MFIFAHLCPYPHSKTLSIFVSAHLCSFMFICTSLKHQSQEKPTICDYLVRYFAKKQSYIVAFRKRNARKLLFTQYPGGIIKLHTKHPIYNTYTCTNILKSILSPKLPPLRHEALIPSPSFHPHTVTRLKTAIFGSTIPFSAFWLNWLTDAKHWEVKKSVVAKPQSVAVQEWCANRLLPSTSHLLGTIRDKTRNSQVIINRS